MLIFTTQIRYHSENTHVPARAMPEVQPAGSNTPVLLAIASPHNQTTYVLTSHTITRPDTSRTDVWTVAGSNIRDNTFPYCTVQALPLEVRFEGALLLLNDDVAINACGPMGEV
jgi:hypothetical protein